MRRGKLIEEDRKDPFCARRLEARDSSPQFVHSRCDVAGLDQCPAAICRPHHEEERKPLLCSESDQLLGQFANHPLFPENKVKATCNAQSEGEADRV